MDIYICVGSACHLKGSYEVIKKFQKVIEENPNSQITLKSSFCLGKCSDLVSVKVENNIFSVSPDSAESFIKDLISNKSKVG